jgi:hypothetical protein
MTAFLIGVLLAATSSLVGDDTYTAVLNHFGYEVRDQPCGTDAEQIRVAVFSNGTTQYNGEAKDAGAIAGIIDQNWLHIGGLCLYVEGPWSAHERDALHRIVEAAVRHEIGFLRFTDADFRKRAVPKIAGLPQDK